MSAGAALLLTAGLACGSAAETGKPAAPRCELLASWDAGTTESGGASEGRETAGSDSRLGPKAVSAICFSPDGRSALVGEESGAVSLWDMAARRLVWRKVEHRGTIEEVVFSADGRRGLAASQDRAATLWDTTAGSVVRRFEGHGDMVQSAVFAAGGRRVLTASDDATVRVWNAGDGTLVRTFVGHPSDVNLVSVTETGREVVSVSGTQGLRVVTWRLSDGRTVREARLAEADNVRRNTMAIDPRRRFLLTGSEFGELQAWDIVKGESVRIVRKHPQNVDAVAFSPSGRLAASGSRDGTLTLWRVGSWESIDQIDLAPEGDAPGAVAFSPDGRFVLLGTKNGRLLQYAVPGT